MSSAIAPIVFQERVAPSRPSRLGTRRRRAPQGRAASEAGVSRPRQRAASLDTEKQLATTVFEWEQSQRTEADVYRAQALLHRQLEATVHAIWQKWASSPKDDGEREWWANYKAAQVRIGAETEAERWKRVEKWLRANKPTGQAAQAVKWERTWRQIQRCQTEWIAYRAGCCGDKSRAIAVPVGCNHRLCPMCAWHRSQVARVRVKTLFDRLTHPVMITLTIPNAKTIRKHDFTLFRQRVRKFIATRKEWIRGGVYSIETTYNRTEKTWHMHAHILADVSTTLPTTRDRKVDVCGKMVLPFTALKWKLEFEWLCLWEPKEWGRMPSIDPPKTMTAKRIAKWASAWERYRQQYDAWVLSKRDNSTKWAKVWDGARFKLRTDLSPAEQRAYAKQSAWNAKHTRVIDVRPVLDRDGAAREVLKYITKVADFGDLPEAVEQFCDAVKGARLIQTFGTWYGAQFDTAFDPDHLDDWGEMKCSCGLNCWERVGIFHRGDVEMDESGRWHLKRALEHAQVGTVAHPTIRAGDRPVERDETICHWETR